MSRPKLYQPQAEIKHLAINVTAPDKYMLKFDRVGLARFWAIY